MLTFFNLHCTESSTKFSGQLVPEIYGNLDKILLEPPIKDTQKKANFSTKDDLLI